MLKTLTATSNNGLGLTAALLIASIGIGTLAGYTTPTMADWLNSYTDITLFVLISCLFISVRFDGLKKIHRKLSLVLIALVANFIIVPLIGYSIAYFLLDSYPLFMVGLMIYFMSPCTDWFLGFTRICHGDALLGSALLPINMLVQLLLYPFYVYLFSHNVVELGSDVIWTNLQHWFLAPLVVAVLVRVALHFILSPQRSVLLSEKINHCIPLIISLLIMQIFAGNIDVLLAHAYIVPWLLLSVLCFFVSTFFLSELLSKGLGLVYAERVLLTMTIAARNAPLMLAITMAALPNQPLIYAAIIIGMLLEFPHLTALSHLLLRSQTSTSEKTVT